MAALEPLSGSAIFMVTLPSAVRSSSVLKMLCAGRRCQLGECFFAFVVAHLPAMMLRHAEAKSALESSRRAARNGISLVPSEGLGAFLQHLDGGHRFVRLTRCQPA